MPMTMPNDTKEKLEIQALHFFAVHDYERSSLNDIADELGVTKGAIYHYFKNKEDLFRAALNRLLDTMSQTFMEMIPGDAPIRPLLEGLFDFDAALHELGDSSGLGDFLSAYENSFYLFLAGVKKFPEMQEKLDGIYSIFIEALESVLKNGIDRGEVRPDTDVTAVAYEITAFYEGALLLGAFTSKKDYLELGPRVCASILTRISTGKEPVNSGTGNSILRALHHGRRNPSRE